jgi:chromate transporter
MLELVLRFLLIGALAFGGGQAALPLVERLAVSDTQWLTQRQFATGVALSYATPGPVLILAAFVGYHVSGVAGAIAASLAVFAVPMLAAGFAAQVTGILQERPWFQSFGRFAAAAAIGLLGQTVLSLGLPLKDIHPALILAASAVAGVALLGWQPLTLLAMGAVSGVAIAAWLEFA